MTAYRAALFLLAAFGLDLARYLSFTAAEGDPLNDWLTHLPVIIRPAMFILGNLLANITEVLR